MIIESIAHFWGGETEVDIMKTTMTNGKERFLLAMARDGYSVMMDMASEDAARFAFEQIQASAIEVTE